MVHTNEEARLLVNTVKETKRILQVGSQTTSADIWWKAKKAIADGMIGQMIESQGSYHRNSGASGIGPSIPMPAPREKATITSIGTCGWARSTSWRPNARAMPTASSVSASIGTIRSASRAICSIT